MIFDKENKIIILTEDISWDEIYKHPLLKICWRIEAESFLKYCK